MRRVLILNLFLLAIVAVLVVQIVALWWGHEPEAEATAPHEAKAQKVDMPKIDRRPAPANLATQISDKDLFDQTRAAAPKANEVQQVGVEQNRPLTLTLLGVSGGGPEREALVKDQAELKPMWIRLGETVGGWKLSRIDPTAILMLGPAGEQVTLYINVEKGKAGGAPIAMGPAGIQPTPTPAAAPVAARTAPHPGAPSPAAVRTPAADIKEKIERLRQEARKRRGQPEAQ